MFTIGMKMRDEYMSFELAKGALTLTRDVMLVLNRGGRGDHR